MLKFLALAVAATVAGPTYSGTVETKQIEQLATRADGSEEQRERQALTVLIQRHWLEGEAVERGIVVTPGEVEEAYAEVADEFDSRKALKAFLRANGYTEATLKEQLRSDLLATAIRDQVLEPAAKSVTPEQVKAYVDAYPQKEAERRHVRFLRTQSRRQAVRAKRDLQRDVRWCTVIRRYTKASCRGPRVVEKGSLFPNLDRAVFTAKRDRIKGPVRTVDGFQVFEVVKVVRERVPPRAEQEAQAWEVLSSRAQETALLNFLAQFTAKWRLRTACAAEYAGHEDCGQPPSGQQTA